MEKMLLSPAQLMRDNNICEVKKGLVKQLPLLHAIVLPWSWSMEVDNVVVEVVSFMPPDGWIVALWKKVFQANISNDFPRGSHQGVSQL